MLLYEIPHDRIRHYPGALNPGLTMQGGIPLHLNDVSLLPIQLGGDLIQGILRFRVQAALAGEEVYLRVGDLLVLIQIGDCGAQLRRLRVGLLRKLLRLTGLRAGLLGLLVCLVGRALRLMNARLRPAIDIFDIAGVLRAELIELVQSVLNGRDLTVDPLFAGQWIEVTPESFIGLGRQGLPGRVRAGIVRICSRS